MQLNLDMFDTDTDADKEVVPVETKINNKVLTKAQKRFNTLIEKIDKLKRQLAQWQQTIPQVQARAANELTPLWKTYNAHRAELVLLLDGAYEKKFFKKKEKEKIRHLICSISSELIGDDVAHALKAVHDKHSDVEFDALAQDQSDMARAMVADILGIEVPDDVNLKDEREFEAFVHQKMHEERLQEEVEMRNAEERRAKRKKTAKQLQREAQQQAQAQDVRKSIQEIYRKLAAALHPDREPDPNERERKTALMQQVNVAYNKKDLLQLLELQIQVEQIDQTHINSMPDARLVHFNKILKEQCDELQQELEDVQVPFKMQFDLPAYVTLMADDVVRRLDMDIADIKKDIAAIRKELVTLQDSQYLRAWLRHYHLPKQFERDDFDFAF